jgi:RNA-binding protein YlmH
LSIEFHTRREEGFYPSVFYGIMSRESEKGGAKMEGSILRAYISENIEKAQRENTPSAVSKFLDSASLSAASALARSTAGRFIFWGGFDGAERVIMLSVPDYIDSDDPNEIFTVYSDECPLSAVRVEKDRFSDIGHRDYLGAVMGLGLTRESVGDICVQPDGCDIIALPNAAKYIEENLTGAGRATLKAKQIPLEEVRAPQVNTKETSITVASPRLDAVAGEIFSLSRSAAAQAIASGAVTVNDEQVLKADRRLSPKDKIVLRGKGRAILGEEFTQTKKGRVRIGVKKSV